MFVRPKPGVRVRRPVAPYTHVPEEGMEVPAEPYWIRRLNDGDLVAGGEGVGSSPLRELGTNGGRTGGVPAPGFKSKGGG